MKIETIADSLWSGNYLLGCLVMRNNYVAFGYDADAVEPQYHIDYFHSVAAAVKFLKDIHPDIRGLEQIESEATLTKQETASQ